MNDLSILPCLLEDLTVLVKLGIETFSETYKEKNTKENFEKYISTAFAPAQIKTELNNPRCHFYFAYSKNALAGYLKLNEPGAQTDLNHPDSLELERIYVKSSHKGLGIGKAFINKALEKAQELQLSKIWLGVWTKNPEAIKFYKKMGFVQIGTHIFTVGDDAQTDIIFEKSI